MNRTVLTALALGFSLAAIIATAEPIPYATEQMINEGDSPAVIAEKAALKKGMEEKFKEFAEKGNGLYAKA